MNFQQFAFFAVVALCLVSCVFSQADSGSTSGGYLRFHSGRASAAAANITDKIIVGAVINVQQTVTGLPINTTDPQAAAAINDTLSYLDTSYKVPPTNITYAPDSAANATLFAFALVWKNNDTSSADSTTSNLFLATNTTNVTQQVDFLNRLVYEMFDLHINAALLESGINVTNITTAGVASFLPPPPPPPHNGTTSTTGASTNGTTTATSPATALSLPSWMCWATVACLAFTYLF
eukprot:Phypoly_transcript_12796.p1 GENE.Phypoly_transcript_12796~~Phypoly_transcript_12796.p1  ORF type:complete len:249 (-),score=48.07 Phypoly_transcript_12796:364-1071(-)